MTRLLLLVALCIAPTLAPAAPPLVLRAPKTDSFGDPLPSGAIARLGTIRWKGTGDITTLAFSPDGKMLAAVCDSYQVRLWDYPSGMPLRQYRTRVDNAGGSLAFTPNQKEILVAGHNVHGAQLIDLASGQLSIVGQFADPNVLDGAVFSSDGRWCLSYDGNALHFKLWLTDLKRSGSTRAFAKVKGQIYQVTLSRDGRWAAVSLTPGNGRPANDAFLFDTATGSFRPLPPLPGINPTKMAFSPDGKSLVAASDTAILRWDMQARKDGMPDFRVACRYDRLGLDEFVVEGMQFSPNGQYLVAGIRDGQVVLWDANTGKAMRTLHVSPQNAVTGMTISPDNKTLAVVTHDDATVRFFDIGTGQAHFQRTGHRGAVSRMAFHPSGKSLVSPSADDCTIRTWDLTRRRTAVVGAKGTVYEDRISGREFRTIEEAGVAYDRVEFADQGRLLIAGRLPSGICLWDTTKREPPKIIASDEGRQSLAVSPNGKTVALAFAMGVETLDVASGQALPVQPNINEPIQWLSFRPDGKTLIAATSAGRLYYWDHVNGRETKPVAVPGQGCARRYAASHAEIDRTIDIWDCCTGRLVRSFEQGYRPFALSPDGRYLAIADRDNGGTILREILSGTTLVTLRDADQAPAALQFSPDGRLLAAGYADGTILLWDVRPPCGQSSPELLKDRWVELGVAEPSKALAALGAFEANPKGAVTLLKDKIKMPEPLPAEELRRLIDDLNHPRYAVRELATKRLVPLAAQLEETLERAAKGAEPEVQKRLERILLAVRKPVIDGEQLRVRRSVEALERIGTPEARELLRKLAKADGPVARDARDSLERLAERQVKPFSGEP